MSWHKGPFAAALAALILVVMIGVPLAGLFGERPQRFGWQMYTVAHEAPEAWAIAPGGSRVPLDIVDRFAILRGDLPDAAAVALAMCAFTDATRVLVELRPGVTGEAGCP